MRKEKVISLKSNGQLRISHIDLLNEPDALEKSALELSENQIRVVKLRKSGKYVKETFICIKFGITGFIPPLIYQSKHLLILQKVSHPKQFFKKPGLQNT